MKLLIICTVPFEKNGITSVILNYYKELHNQINMDLVVNNIIADEYHNLFKKYNSDVFYIPNRKKNPFSYMFNLYTILKKNKYDIIHIHGNSALTTIELLPAYFANISTRIVHSHNTTCDYKLINNILKPIFNNLYTHGLACSTDAGKWMFSNRKFSVLNNGIDLDKYKFDLNKRNEIRTNLNVNDKFVIGHVGGFVYQKNHQFLIELFSKLKEEHENIELVCLGDGPEFENIIKLSEKLNVSSSIQFLGNKSNINDYYQAFDMFLLPSHFEGLPVVLVEAQANGLDILVSENVSNEVNLTNKLQFLPHNDTESWKKSINSLINNGKNRINLSNENCKILEEKGYSIKKNSRELFEYYKNHKQMKGK